MLATPAGFVPLHTAQPAARTRFFVFRGDQLLVREADLALPEDDIPVLDAFGLGASATYPIGLLGEYYCCAAAVDAQASALDGYVFSGLRPLFAPWTKPCSRSRDAGSRSPN